MGLISWLFKGCWHNYHETGNQGKRIIERHGKFGNYVHVMMEEQCCKCGNIRWEPQWIDSHDGTPMYDDDNLPELQYV